MKEKLYIFVLVLFGSNSYAQIDGNLLLGLTNATTTEIQSINNPVVGSIIYNTSINGIFHYTGSTWESVKSASSAWNSNGNSGTTSSTDFIGTTDVQDFVLKSNNIEKLRLVKDRGQVLVNQASVFNNHPMVIKANGVDVLAFEDSTGAPKWHWNLLQNGLNFVESNVADYRLFLENGGQVGINTNTPTNQLDVNGSARIRVLENATDNDNVITADTDGVLHQSKINYGGRWTNSNTSTNLNVNNSNVPIFGTQDYLDAGTSLYQVNGNTLIVKEAGRYDIRANIYLLGIFNNSRTRTNTTARIAVNGAPVGAMGATGYIRFTNNHEESSLHLNEIIQLNVNDVITIVTFMEANTGEVRFNGSGTSSFMINKLK
ncbi:hypothetical protein [Maribacter sp. HTCC2170]|uniref:hypothetical protein n=1 Tax=Maribacter sp. (strain HTCC2170 / KCCM 42371) TaxID=313603 RepID=UPI00006B1A7C|nr:hypothetical protein [Maribacter sp. HTCC2170]EAR00731.1 hypothetical protein FB2170_16641 [Maribacter sp. HTCC2170]